MRQQETMKRGLGALAGLSLLVGISACVSMATTDKMTPAEMQAKHTECMAMHDKMMADTQAGKPMDHSTMTPEMHAKHESCMKMMSGMNH